MKKYRNPKTGEIIGDMLDSECAECLTCPVSPDNNGRHMNCGEFLETYPTEAARLMGYEIIEEDEPVEENKKPRICEVLGVDPDEEWTFYLFEGTYRIHDGQRQIKRNDGTWGYCDDEVQLTELINYHGLIVHKTLWTAEDVEDAKALMRVYAGVPWAARDKGGGLWFYDLEPDFKDGVSYKAGDNMYPSARNGLLPSLRPGEKVRLADIVEAEG